MELTLKSPVISINDDGMELNGEIVVIFGVFSSEA
jgi:hypothetical protein